jgi:hypothetical protein
MSPDESALSAVIRDGRVVGERWLRARFRRTSREGTDIIHEDPMLGPTEGAVAGVDLLVYELRALGDAFVGHTV